MFIMALIGLISDTHGLLRAEAIAALTGCDHIIHGGDIGSPGILAALSALAPVTAVRGNNDRDAAWKQLPEAVSVVFDDVLVYALHDVSQLAHHPAPPGTRVIVSGHSHKPRIEERAGVLYVNPGSAGPRRFKLPIAVAELAVTGQAVSAKIIHLPMAVAA